MKKVIFLIVLFFSLVVLCAKETYAAIPTGISINVIAYDPSGGPFTHSSTDLGTSTNGKMAVLVEASQWTDDWHIAPEDYITHVNISSDSSIYYTLVLEIDYGGNFYNQMYFDLRNNNDVEIAYTVDLTMYDLEIDYGNGIQSGTFYLINVPNHRFYILDSNYISNEIKQQYYDDGYDDGYIVGHSVGHDVGVAEGVTTGYNNGRIVGISEGEITGYAEGYDAAEDYYHDNGFGVDDDTSASYAAGFAAAEYQPEAERAILTAAASVLGLGGSWLIYLNDNFSLFGITLFIVFGVIIAVAGVMWILKR